MNDEPECIHGLGPVSACTICNGKDALIPEYEPPRRIVSRYTAVCPECTVMICPGDIIWWYPDYNQPTVHESCHN